MSDATEDERRLAETARRLDELMRTRPGDDPQVALARNNLAIQYRNSGQPRRAADLFAGVPVCAHLEPVRAYLVERGAAITYAGAPWSRNCRTWIYFDRVIDPAELIARFGLAACVVAHVHRGTHEGSEQGLVCQEHHDALMGPLPTDVQA